MLALVHPLQHAEVQHRPASRPSLPRQHSVARKQSSSGSAAPSASASSASSSRSANLAPRHPAAPPPLPLPLPPQKPPSTHRHHSHNNNPRPVSPVIKPLQSPPPPPTQVLNPSFDIHSYPAPELLRLLASLLTQIAATNDKLEAASPASLSSDPPSNIPSRTSLSSVRDSDAPIWRTLTTASRTAISTPSSTLTFHARNVPTISLEAYLLRILKYCPTTNEVFLSLLVYFDRMTKMSEEATGRTFVIDSYNIHRLVIAGVTVASKFFSDVFYTNSRYAKVRIAPLSFTNVSYLTITTGRRSTPIRTKPTRTPIPPSKRLQASYPRRRNAAICRAADPIFQF